MYNKYLTHRYSQGKHYALVFKSDSNIRLDFYNAGDTLVKTQFFLPWFKPKKHHTNAYRDGEELIYEHGVLVARNYYVRGFRQGRMTEYDNNGVLFKSYICIRDVKIGDELTYDKLGNILYRGYWHQNKRKEGVFCYRLKNGLSSMLIYNNFSYSSKIYFDSKGDTVSVYTYELSEGQNVLKTGRYFREGKFESDQQFGSAHRRTFFDIKKDTNFTERPVVKNDSFKLAEFTGGIYALFDHVDEHLSYSENLRINGVSVVIRVGFLIGKEGNVLEVFTDGMGDKEMQEQAIEMLMLTDGMWIPAMNNNRKITTYGKILLNYGMYESSITIGYPTQKLQE